MKRFDWYRLLPQYWIQSGPTDWQWDAELNRLLDEYPVVLNLCGKSFYTVNLGNTEIWVRNWPYSFGDHHRRGTLRSDELPSVKTRIRLRKAVERAVKEYVKCS